MAFISFLTTYLGAYIRQRRVKRAFLLFFYKINTYIKYTYIYMYDSVVVMPYEELKR